MKVVVILEDCQPMRDYVVHFSEPEMLPTLHYCKAVPEGSGVVCLTGRDFCLHCGERI